jgi:translocation and assembly module TamA
MLSETSEPLRETALYVTLVAALVLLSAVAHAESARTPEGDGAYLRFRVVLDAPKPLAAMLEQGLVLMRWQRDERMTLDLLQRLVTEARTEVERAVAAEGYLSPTVRTAIEMQPETYVVRIHVEPGPRTLVSQVDLRFRGVIADDPAGAARMAAVRAAWPLRPGEPFRQADWEAAKRKAVTELARERYAARPGATHGAAAGRARQRASLPGG